jgi:hypothetical protein
MKLINYKVPSLLDTTIQIPPSRNHITHLHIYMERINCKIPSCIDAIIQIDPFIHNSHSTLANGWKELIANLEKTKTMKKEIKNMNLFVFFFSLVSPSFMQT